MVLVALNSIDGYKSKKPAKDSKLFASTHTGIINPLLYHLSLLLAIVPATLAVDGKPGGPVHPGQPANCVAWHTVKQGDDCNSVPKQYYISREQFLAWNPAVSEDCTENFWLKSAYCVAVDETGAETGAETSTKSAVSSKLGTSGQFTTASVESTTPMPTRATTKITSSNIVSSISQPSSQNATRSATTTYSVRHPISTWNITAPTIDKTWPPKATQAGQPSNCNKWHLVRGGQTCRSVLNKYSSFMREREL